MQNFSRLLVARVAILALMPLFSWGQIPGLPEPDWKVQFERDELARKQQNQQDAREDAERNRPLTLKLVAMISGEMDGAPISGAGIVFGRGLDKVYVVTANHVVRRGTTET